MMKDITIKADFVQFIRSLQDELCDTLEQVDGKATFIEDNWKRNGGGGGCTRIIQHGDVFEKGGVNISEVEGKITDVMKQRLGISGSHFFATGISLVLHPMNPYIPTVHANFRYFELYDEQYKRIDQWFGGGTDLTPYYLFEEDAIHFHTTLKETCDRFDDTFYPVFKRNCDEYFVNHHRNAEARGIGGIFYDHLRPEERYTEDFYFRFSKSCAESFMPAYLPIVQKSINTPYDEHHRHWQEIRRGRYAEFNLLHDRGTLFGLQTNGRVESIFMSLPPVARFEYKFNPLPGSPEEKLTQVLSHPVDWIKIATRGILLH